MASTIHPPNCRDNIEVLLDLALSFNFHTHQITLILSTNIPPDLLSFSPCHSGPHQLSWTIHSPNIYWISLMSQTWFLDCEVYCRGVVYEDRNQRGNLGGYYNSLVEFLVAWTRVKAVRWENCCILYILTSWIYSKRERGLQGFFLSNLEGCQ